MSGTKQPHFQKRIMELRGLMEGKSLDAALVNSQNDIFYYTGLDLESSYLLIPRNSGLRLFLSSLENQAEGAKGLRTIFIRDIPDMAKAMKGFRCGFDEHSTSFSVYSKLKKQGLRLTPSASIIKQPRMRKDEFETERIRKAAEIARRAVSGLGSIQGKREIEIADRIDFSFRKAGTRNSFDTIVASGRHSAFVHHRPDDNMIRQNDLTIVDLGAKPNGYCSDMTRTFCKRPGHRERNIMENISEIQAELIDMAVEGVKYDDIQKRYESLLKRKGYRLMHSFGHGIGIGVHERPGKGDVLKAGMVITIEPGAYIRGFGGCRKEDMILVRKGSPNILTRLRKEGVP